MKWFVVQTQAELLLLFSAEGFQGILGVWASHIPI